jgi:hypothetical protein
MTEPRKIPVPSVGRVVHYWPSDPPRLPNPAAAIILCVHDTPDRDDVTLVVFSAPALKSGQRSLLSELPLGVLTFVRCERADVPRMGCWSWPQFVPERVVPRV